MPAIVWFEVNSRVEDGRHISSFDDDKTQSAVRFLCKLDATLKFNDKVIGEATLFALDSILKSQFPNGGWMLL